VSARNYHRKTTEDRMKTLLLLRHAKSSWKDTDARDFDRPLNQRGLKAAPSVGRLMKKRKLEPDLVLSSPAERARQTTQLVLESAKLKPEVRHDERIYEATGARLFEIVAQIDDDANLAMLVGHNPGLEELLATLTGEAHTLQTAALACIELEIEKWSKLRAGAGRLQWLVKPKELKSV
jgi:phosphohistidine phosphatase